MSLVAASGLVLFFVFVFRFCAPFLRQNAGPRPDSIEMKRKSPFGGWRY
jgi:hypothetical protein